MRTLLSIALLLSSLAQAQLLDDDRVPPLLRRATLVRPEFEFFPEGGEGIPSITPLCDAVTASDKNGTWFCLKGDGSMATGSTVSLTPQGAVLPSTHSPRVCPNGPDCAALTGQLATDVSSGFAEVADVNRSGSVTTGSWTQCWHGLVRSHTTEKELMGLSSSGSTPWRNMLYITTSTVFASYISTGVCGAAISVVNSGITLTSGAPHFLCITWNSSDGIYRTYVDGVAGAVSAASTTICGGGSTSRYAVSGFWGGAITSSPIGATTFGAFSTDIALSPSRIAELARATLADAPMAANGTALVFSRSGPGGFCASSDGTGSMLPSGRACVGNNELTQQSAYAHYELQTEDFDSGSWSKVAAGGGSSPVVTADYTLAPWGVNTADRIQFSACPTVGDASVVAQTTTPGSSPASFGVWAKAVTGTPSISVCHYSTVLPGDRLCTQFALSTATWTRIKSENRAFTTQSDWGIGCENRTAAYTGATNTGAADVIIVGAQVQNSPFLTRYVRNTSATSTTSAELIGFTYSMPTSAGVCVAATVSTVSTSAFFVGAGIYAPTLSSGAVTSNPLSPYFWPYNNATGPSMGLDATGSAGAPVGYNPGTTALLLQARYAAGHNGTALFHSRDGVLDINSTPSAWLSPTFASIRLYAQTTTPSYAGWRNVQADRDWTRCSR